MLIAHEIGHNFNLRHPFDVGEDKGDLKLHQGQTLENIMDYLPDAEETYKSFITYQWEKVREYLDSNKNIVEELQISISEKRYNSWMYLIDFQEDNRNLLLFSATSLQNVILNSEQYYSEDSKTFVEIESAIHKTVLTTYVNAIKTQVDTLCFTN